jgi:hypothetical protein
MMQTMFFDRLIRTRQFVLRTSLAVVVLAGCSDRESEASEVADAVVDLRPVAPTLIDVSTSAAVEAVPQARPDSIPADSIAELPRATVNPRVADSAGTRVVKVAKGGNLQSALNRARGGDVIMLASGASYVGNFTLPKRQCSDGWVTIRTDVPDSVLPAPGARMTPALARPLARLATPNHEPVLRTENPTCRWRFVGVEITVDYEGRKAPDITYTLMALGDGGWKAGGDTQTSLDRVPAEILLDRVFVHGTPTTNLVRCIAINTARSAVVDSWISDCHAKGFDSQAIEGWNGPGPFLIENNFLAGAGENVMFGGADPGIPNLSPSDITIRRNHFWKDPAWKGRWTVKNLFELKHAKRVLVEGNVFENNWADGQSGMAIVIKSSSDGDSAPQSQSADVTFRYNIVRNSPRGFNVQGIDGRVGTPVARVRAEHNLFYNIGEYNGTSSGWLNQITHVPSDVAIRHNTMVNNTTDAGIALVMDYGNGQARRLTVEDNIFTSPAGYAVFYSGTQAGVASLRAMTGDSWKFARNVVAGMQPDIIAMHPRGNFYPPTIAAIGFFDPANGDYRLSSRSTFKRLGRGGTDPGANIAEINRRTAGVVMRVER